MYKNIFPTEVTVIIYSVKNIKPNKKGLKYCVIISIGNVKYRTDLIQDANGCPQFDTESVLHVENPKLPLQLVATEKKEKEFFGQLVIPLETLGSVRSNREIVRPLQVHKKCSKPTAEIHYEVWISKCITSIAPEIKIFGNNNSISSNDVPVEKKGPFSGLKKTLASITNSPKMMRKQKYNDEQGGFSKTSNLKYSNSCLDLTNGYKNKTIFSNLKNEKPQFYGSSITLNEQFNQTDGISTLSNDYKSTQQQLSSYNNNSALYESTIFEKDDEDNGYNNKPSKLPEISGISPNMGTLIGGTKITIRGKNLGDRKEDIIGLFVCGSNILSSLEYVNSSKILCTTKPWKPGEGVITIETQSGGKSNSTLKFTFSDGLENDGMGQEATVKRAESWNKEQKEKHKYLNYGSPEMVPKNKSRLHIFAPLGNCRSMTDLTNINNTNNSVFGNSAALEAKYLKNSLTSTQMKTTNIYNNSVMTKPPKSGNPPIIQIFPMKNEQTSKKGKKIEQELMEWKNSANDLNMKTQELAEENKRLKGYIEKLVSQIMVKCPEVLCTDNHS